MSFIFGIIDLKGKPVSKEELKSLGEAVKWENFKERTELINNVAWGITTHPERKPKAGFFENEELMVLADIRIYNEPELKQSFDYTLPEEAVAKAFSKWGEKCADYIKGDFAAMVYNKKRNQAHLFRDHIGARPMAYWFSDDKLIFASHEFGLVKSGLIKTSLNEKKLVENLFRYKNNYSEILFKDVWKVTPGFCVSFSAGRKKVVAKYWKPEKIKKNKALSVEEVVSRLRELMVTATVNRMEPVKTGAHVSGGIDSTGVASIVADHIQDTDQLMGYSWTPDEYEAEMEGMEISEKEYINAFSEEKHVKIRYLKLGAEHEITRDSLIPEFAVQHIEHPTMKKASEDNIETMFNGWGGDEFVSLSARGVVNHLVFNFKLRAILKYIGMRGIKSFIWQLRTDVIPLLIPFGLLPVYKAQYYQRSVIRLLKPAFVLKHWRTIFFNRRKNIFGYGNRTRFMLNLLENYHMPSRMDSWAINGERYGFDYKYPLVDKDLLEFWFSIPVEYTYKDFGSRILYREAMKGILTEKIRIRPDKADPLFMDFMFKERAGEENYLASLFYGLKDQEHLPGFRPKSFEKLIHRKPSKKRIENLMKGAKIVFYLHHVKLVKEYLS
ncbi:MAG: hypothetical protein IH595_07720 [Bacteroidales bacterium]|nr:hypothetical protein [Bacteroidales bacterium]